jgi:hypothetical protein
VDISVISGKDKNRAVLISVKINTGTMTYYDDDNVLQTVTMNGWTFTGIADFGATPIADLNTDMLRGFLLLVL